MKCRIDDGFKHEAKIVEKKLSCPPLSGFNHMAVYLRWAYNKGLLLDSVLESEPRLKAALDGEGDLREVIANSELLKGKINTDLFTEEGALFTRVFYQFNDCKYVYPLCVDKNAKAYFGERYKDKHFKHEAYLFVPYDEAYYVNLSKYIDDAWNNRSGIIVEHKPVLLAVRLTPGVINKIFNNKPGHFPDKKSTGSNWLIWPMILQSILEKIKMVTNGMLILNLTEHKRGSVTETALSAMAGFTIRQFRGMRKAD